MSITSKKKSELISEYCLAQNDTGSSFVQCAILTERVRNLTEHLKVHKKDSHSRLGLLILVARRRNLLKYIKSEYGNSRYASLIEKLGIRDVCH